MSRAKQQPITAAPEIYWQYLQRYELLLKQAEENQHALRTLLAESQACPDAHTTIFKQVRKKRWQAAAEWNAAGYWRGYLDGIVTALIVLLLLFFLAVKYPI